MSLGIIIKSPEGIVLAAESRVTIGATITNPNGQQQQTHVNFDNARKVLSLSDSLNETYRRFGIVTYGLAVLGGLRTAQSLIPEFETHLQVTNNENLSVFEFAEKLSEFFMIQWHKYMANINIAVGSGMIFNVAGFDDNEPYGKIYQFEIPHRIKPLEQNPKIGEQYAFGITAGGQNEIMARILLGFDPRLVNILIQQKIIRPEDISRVAPALEQLKLQVPIQLMPLQDCINLAVLLIKTTIEAQSLSIGIRGCGGEIDVAIIQKGKQLKFIKEKNINVY